MATGDDATAAGIPLVPGTAQARDIDEWINRLADELARRTMTTLSITRGGTGATSKEAARANLDVASAAEVGKRASINTLNQPYAVAQIETATPHQIGLYFNDGVSRVVSRVDATDFPLAYKSEVDGANNTANSANSNADGRVAKGGDTMTGNLFLPNATAAASSFQVAYINGDGRVCRGSSSQRYKKYISPFEPQALGDIFPAFQRYKMRTDGIAPSEEKWRYGYIAEQLAQHPDQEQFVVYRDVNDTGEEVPDSIDFIGLLLAQVAQLNQRIIELEAARA